MFDVISVRKISELENTADPGKNYLCSFAYFDRKAKEPILCCEKGFYLVDDKYLKDKSVFQEICKVTGALI